MAGDRIFGSFISAALSLKTGDREKESDLNPSFYTKDTDPTLKFTEDINTLFPANSLITLLYAGYRTPSLKDDRWQMMEKSNISEETFACSIKKFLFCGSLTKREVFE